MTSDELKVRDLLRAGELDGRQVVASDTSQRLFDRRGRRPSGCSERLYSSLGVKDPLAMQDQKTKERLAAAERFRSIDKQKKEADTRPKSPPPPKPVRYADTQPKPLDTAPTVPVISEEQALTDEAPQRPALPTRQEQRAVGKSGRPRTVRAARRRWEAAPAPVPVVSRAAPIEEQPAPPPPRPEAAGMEGLFSGGNSRPRLGRRRNSDEGPSDG